MSTGVFCTTPTTRAPTRHGAMSVQQRLSHAVRAAKSKARDNRILQLLDDKVSVDDIAARPGVKRNTAVKNIARLRNEGRLI